MALKLRVVFQGGGARLATLLVAADALRNRCRKANIEICEVAGVSAGSIVAAAVASKLDLEEVRSRIVSVGESFSARFRQEMDVLRDGLAGPVAQDVAAALEQGLTYWSMRRLAKHKAVLTALGNKLRDLLQGGSILSFEEVDRALAKVFRDGERPLTFADLDIPLTVFSSDLRTGAPIAYDASCSDPLHTILARSASMPFIFRSFAENNFEVDGGICGNLPVTLFLASTDHSMRTMAFAFKDESPRSVDGITNFGQALLSSAMDSSVREAKSQVREAGGLIYELPNHLSTYDFYEAIKTELEPHRFRTLSAKIEDDLCGHLDQLFGSVGYKLVRQTRYGQNDIPVLFDKLHAAHPIQKTRSVKIIVRGEARSKTPSQIVRGDERYYIDYLSPLNSVVQTCQVGLPTGLQSITNMSVRTRDVSGTDIAASSYLHIFEHEGKAGARVLVFLDVPIPAARCPVSVAVKFEGDVFSDYENQGWDFQRTLVTLQDQVDEQIWIGVLDDGGVTLHDMGVAPPQYDQETVCSARELHKEGSWVTGKRIPPTEASSLLRSLYSGELVDSVVTFGWRVGQMKRGQSSGFLYQRG
jgi:predicted acylesterase/phospholipase RssA